MTDTLQQMRIAKMKLEGQIGRLIQEFADEHEVIIDSADFNVIDTRTMDKPLYYTYTIQFRIYL